MNEIHEGEKLKNRIDDAIRNVKKGRGQKYYEKCVLYMNSESHNILVEYFESKNTVMGDGPVYAPGTIHPYRGMKIVLDESVTWDFHIQHPISNEKQRFEILEGKVRELERHRDEMAAYLGRIESFMTKLCKSTDDWRL